MSEEEEKKGKGIFKKEDKLAEEKKKPSGKGIRVAEFMLSGKLPNYAIPVIREHLKKAVGPVGSKAAYEAELKKYLEREIE